MLRIHGNAVNEETIVALRIVKDHILMCKGVMNVNISQDLIKSVHSASQRYNEFLNAKKEEEKKAEEEKEEKKVGSCCCQQGEWRKGEDKKRD